MDTETPLELPALDEGMLSDDGVRQLIAELGAHAEVFEVGIKGGAQARGQRAVLDLPAALDGLLAGEHRAIQVRYRFQGAEWCDTVLRAPGGWRVVRMCQGDQPARP